MTRRGGVRARNYVLHVNKSHAIGSRGDYLYLDQTAPPSGGAAGRGTPAVDATGMDGGGATHCGRRAEMVNCASKGCDYSPEELCRVCRSRFSAKAVR